MSYTPADISQKLHQRRLKSHSDVAAVDSESEPSWMMSGGEREGCQARHLYVGIKACVGSPL